eukprot:1188203-Prorocentrum_minimum.AAC.2
MPTRRFQPPIEHSLLTRTRDSRSHANYSHGSVAPSERDSPDEYTPRAEMFYQREHQRKDCHIKSWCLGKLVTKFTFKTKLKTLQMDACTEATAYRISISRRLGVPAPAPRGISYPLTAIPSDASNLGIPKFGFLSNLWASQKHNRTGHHLGVSRQLGERTFICYLSPLVKRQRCFPDAQ